MDELQSRYLKTLISAPREPSQDLDKLAHAAIGAAIEVHRHLGPGLLEPLYEEAFCLELVERQIAFERQLKVPISYKGHPIGENKLDLLIREQLIVEVKAVERLAPIHSAQLISYLRIKGLQLGLLINFNVLLLKEGIKRVVLS